MITEGIQLKGLDLTVIKGQRSRTQGGKIIVNNVSKSIQAP